MDLTSVFVLLTAMGLGLGHSFDPDHIVAISAIVCNNKRLRRSIASAIIWGLGHSVVLLLVGFIVLALKVAIPDGVINIFKLAAAVMIILLGSFILRPLINEKLFKQTISEKIHTHTHIHDNHDHTHFHHHKDHNNHSHFHKSALTGILQGLGGSAGVMLVALTTVSSVEIGLGFVLLFGVGVIIGMVGISFMIGSVMVYAANNFIKVHKIIAATTGISSIIIGISIVVSLVLSTLQ
jgi:ABC-type nickel/cobalt efflux system permease component RcnA